MVRTSHIPTYLQIEIKRGTSMAEGNGKAEWDKTRKGDKTNAEQFKLFRHFP